MGCYYHGNATVIGTCTMCKKPLCGFCYNKYLYTGKAFCEDCARMAIEKSDKAEKLGRVLDKVMFLVCIVASVGLAIFSLYFMRLRNWSRAYQIMSLCQIVTLPFAIKLVANFWTYIRKYVLKPTSSILIFGNTVVGRCMIMLVIATIGEFLACLPLAAIVFECLDLKKNFFRR